MVWQKILYKNIGIEISMLWKFDKNQKNAFYLKEVLQHQQSDEIKIMLNSPLSAGLFLPMDNDSGDDKTTLLMPIRLND